MNVYIVYKKSTGENVAQYLGDRHTEKNILDANEYDQTYDCVMCELESGYDLAEYSFNLVDGIIKTPKTAQEKKLFRIQKKLGARSNEFNMIIKLVLIITNNTRAELSLPPYTKQDVINILKDIF